jgi:hypothetical protein
MVQGTYLLPRSTRDRLNDVAWRHRKSAGAYIRALLDKHFAELDTPPVDRAGEQVPHAIAAE